MFVFLVGNFWTQFDLKPFPKKRISKKAPGYLGVRILGTGVEPLGEAFDKSDIRQANFTTK